MRRHSALWASALLPLLVTGCSVDLGEVPFYCCKGCNHQCPDGYECKETYCVKKGSCPDFVPGCASKELCGNGTCDPGETLATCPADCTPNAVCGDDTCSPGETCVSCPKDCGACPPGCGNGTCDPGETAQGCPADCGGGAVCGNGKCEAGESSATCPADCSGGSCSANETQCDGTDKIKICDGGSWKTENCDSLCKSSQYDYSAGCDLSADQTQYVCLCGQYAGFGDLCDDSQLCDPSLFCGSFDPARPGFCTKYCTTPQASCSGAPAGVTAQCVLPISGQYACGFVCDVFTSCPQGMTCDTASSVCKP